MKEKDLKTVLVTNGCVEDKIAGQLLPLADALNIDLKCFDAETYRNVLGGDLETVKRFFLSVGFETLTFTTADEHDKIIAYTSQLAHIVSNAYVKSPTALQRKGFSAGSYRDMTRVAKLNVEMWTELFLENRDELFPIPNTEIVQSNGSLVQNPGY